MVERARSSRVGVGGNYFSTPKSAENFIKSGSSTLDLALGGGWAEGRTVNIIGDRAVGKTLLCIEAAANFDKKYPKKEFPKARVRYRESESAFDEPYAGAIGMPLDRVDFGDHPLETVEDLFNDLEDSIARALKNKQPELYICDSLDALSDEAEKKRKFGEASYGGDKAKDISRMFRKLPLKQIEESRITIMIVSQIRDNIGVKFGRKWKRSGGHALDFYTSQIVVLANLGKIPRTINKVKRFVGINIKAHLDKNKVGIPFREAEFPILFGYGIDDLTSCLDYLDSVGSLGELLDGMKDNVFENTIRNREGDYKKQIKRMQDLVEKRWYQIEDTFLPKYRKYQE